VKEGDPLCVIEAMKMENMIYADFDAVVETVHVNAPDSVGADEMILEFVKSDGATA
jgi:propionyl-CoA carboxylase alpha chain